MQKPGEPFSGTHRMAYIPDCEQGRKAVRLLKSAFMLGSVFQVGFSPTQHRDGPGAPGALKYP